MSTDAPESAPTRSREDLRGIGAVAGATGVSERTLRYYEELGLIRPAAHRAGGSRLYSEADIERVQRIRELQELMGFNLEEIRTVLFAEDRLGVLRGQYRTGTGDRAAVVEEAIATLESLRAQVDVKLARLQEFRAGFDARLERLRPRLEEARASSEKDRSKAGAKSGSKPAARPRRAGSRPTRRG